MECGPGKSRPLCRPLIKLRNACTLHVTYMHRASIAKMHRLPRQRLCKPLRRRGGK